MHSPCLSKAGHSVLKLRTRKDTIFTGIIPFSRLGVFYANLGSEEIFFANRKRGPQNGK